MSDHPYDDKEFVVRSLHSNILKLYKFLTHSVQRLKRENGME